MGVLVRSALTLVVLAQVSACASPAPASSPAASAARSLPADFPVGSWTSHLTETDLRAAGYTDSATIDENVGDSTLTLGADGSWTIAVESNRPMRWPVFRGTYAITGPKAFRMLTTFPPDLAGEVVDLEWAHEPDGLQLRAIDPYDPIIHVQFETHPWLRNG
jgi:hypothetical protein